MATACVYCGKPLEEQWPAVMFRGTTARWCGSSAEATMDATAMAHPFCYADKEGNEALTGLMPAAFRRSAVEVGRGNLADGTNWILFVEDLQTDKAAEGDLSFSLIFEHGALGPRGGPLWGARSTEQPQPLSVMAQLGHGGAHVVPGAVSKDAHQVLAHLSDSTARPATLLRAPTLPFDVFIASAPKPLYVDRIEAIDANRRAIGPSRDCRPDELLLRVLRRRPAEGGESPTT